jgi:hypothetical protein
MSSVHEAASLVVVIVRAAVPLVVLGFMLLSVPGGGALN